MEIPDVMEWHKDKIDIERGNGEFATLYANLLKEKQRLKHGKKRKKKGIL